jgi:hypothetical protein
MKIKYLLSTICALALSACNANQQAEVTTLADTVGTDVKTYAQDLAVMLQTVNGIVQVTAPVAKAIASQWGLLPANSSQLATFNTVVTDSSQVGTDAAALNSLLTSISTTGVVPTTSVPTTYFRLPARLPLRAPFGEHDPYNVLMARN